MRKSDVSGVFVHSLAKPVKTFLGIIVRRHLTIQKQMGLLKRAVRRITEGISAVLLQSGLDEKMVGGFHGMLLLYAKNS